MSKFALLVFPLLLSGSAVADIVSPDCLLSWSWTFNSLGQNACTVAAYLQSTCNQGSFTITTLLSGYEYTGPNGDDDGNLCKCSTVAYNLMSACGACQSHEWITWSEFSLNCTTKLPPSTFPNPVPAGTRVPQWALLDPTPHNNWNDTTAKATGDSPELAPGAIINPPNASSSHSSGPTSTSSSTSSASILPPPTSSSNPGAIAGGVVGGIAIISITVFAVFYFKRRTRESHTFEIDVTSPLPVNEARRSLPAGPSHVLTPTPWTPPTIVPHNTRAKKFAQKFVRNPGPTPPPSYGTRSLA